MHSDPALRHVILDDCKHLLIDRNSACAWQRSVPVPRDMHVRRPSMRAVRLQVSAVILMNRTNFIGWL